MYIHSVDGQQIRVWLHIWGRQTDKRRQSKKKKNTIMQQRNKCEKLFTNSCVEFFYVLRNSLPLSVSILGRQWVPFLPSFRLVPTYHQLRTFSTTADKWYYIIRGHFPSNRKASQGGGLRSPNPIIKALLPGFWWRSKQATQQRVGATKKTLCVFYDQITFWRLRKRRRSLPALLVFCCGWYSSSSPIFWGSKDSPSLPKVICPIL